MSEVAGQPWSDRDKLAYVFCLIQAGVLKPEGTVEWKSAPIPAGRTLVACQRMYAKLRTSMKEECTKLLAGETTGSPTKKTTKATAKVSKQSGGAGTKRKATKSSMAQDDDDNNEEAGDKKAKVLKEEPEED